MKKINIRRKDFETVDGAVKEAVNLVKRGYQEKQVVARISRTLKNIKIPFSAKDVYTAAKLRIKAKEKFGNLSQKLFFDESGYRYSTPALVAEYRAKRLKNYSIADVSCGSGLQLAFFGFFTDATGVELNKKRAYIAKMNITALNSSAEVYFGDAFEYRANEEVIFSDPARPESEEIRTLRGLQPNPVKLAEKFSDKLLAFELPPQMPPERVDRSFSVLGGKIKGEKEYTSIRFRLNRLAFYSGELATCKVSALSLPSGERVTSDDSKAELKNGKIGEILAEVDRTVVHAGLLENLVGKLDIDACIAFRDLRRTVLSVSEVTNSAFLRHYEVVCKAKSLSECREKLEQIGARKVTLRFSIDPRKYWDIRKKLESGLKGDKHIYLFRFDKFIMCTSLTEREWETKK